MPYKSTHSGASGIINLCLAAFGRPLIEGDPFGNS